MRETRYLCDRCKRDMTQERRYELVVYVTDPDPATEDYERTLETDFCKGCVETLLPALRAQE